MDSTSKRKITRARESLTCTECRRRKLKCDRCAPCGSCIKRGDHATCTYQRFPVNARHERERRFQAESRLEHLEVLVQRLSRQSGEFAHQGDLIPQESGQLPNGGDCQMEHGGLISQNLRYNGSTHWSAMLEDIEGLRNSLISGEVEAHDGEISDAQSDVATKLVLGPASPLPLQEVLAQYLPPQPESDGLIAIYFRSAGIAAPFIHAASFQRQYSKFWQESQETPILWISILFSIFHIASSTVAPVKENIHLEEKYIVASASCLALGEYYRPQKYSIESLLLFAQAHILSGPSMSPNVGLIFGLLTRLATSMGYHRDPAASQFSAFEKEMRRRVWSLCMQLDLLISFQLGLPSNIQFPTWDTLPPSNLHDADFDEETVELPPARPDSETTNIIFYIAKHRLMAVFEKILRHTLATGEVLACRVDELDNEVREVYSNLPDNLRPKSISDSIFDSPKTVVTRLCVFNLFQKSLVVLHRPYVTQGRLHSIQTCHEAALNIVKHFNDSYKQFLPGGQMDSERWFLGSLTWHDYLLGVTALCLALCASSQHPLKPKIDMDQSLNVLRQACDVCVESSLKSKDSTRVSRLSTATVIHFGNPGSVMNGSDSVNASVDDCISINSPSRETSLLDHTDDSHLGPLFGLPHPASSNETMISSMDDPSWGYLEQFLNISGDDVIAIN